MVEKNHEIKRPKSQFLGLLESVSKQGVFQEASQAIENINKDHQRSSIVSPKEQDNGCKRSNIVSPKDHQRSSIVSPKEQQYKDNKTTKIMLSKYQEKVYLWLLNRGLSGEFNKNDISRELLMPYITVRKVILKLKNLNILNLSYNNHRKSFDYFINANLTIKIYEENEKTIQSKIDKSFNEMMSNPDGEELLLKLLMKYIKTKTVDKKALT